jgi:hypothetical protein
MSEGREEGRRGGREQEEEEGGDVGEEGTDKIVVHFALPKIDALDCCINV